MSRETRPNRISASRALVVFGVALGLGLGIGGVGAPPAVSAGSFCKDRLLRDYEQPLRQMPKLRRPPASGRLTFGPKALALERSSTRLVVGRNREAGMQLVNRSGKPLKSLNLAIVASLSRVNDKGQVVKRLQKRTWDIERLKALETLELAFRVGVSPASYRVDVAFSTDGGQRRLPTFSEYFLVPRPAIRVRLASSSSFAQPGEVMRFRLLNPGAVPISISHLFAIERLSNGQWIRDASLTPMTFAPVAVSVGPGGASGCLGVPIPEGTAPGQYRFARSVKAVISARTIRDIDLTVPFQVLG